MAPTQEIISTWEIENENAVFFLGEESVFRVNYEELCEFCQKVLLVKRDLKRIIEGNKKETEEIVEDIDVWLKGGVKCSE